MASPANSGVGTSLIIASLYAGWTRSCQSSRSFRNQDGSGYRLMGLNLLTSVFQPSAARKVNKELITEVTELVGLYRRL
jgi:hypothetical protein